MADNDDYDDISVEEMDAIDAEVMRSKSSHRPPTQTLPELMIRLALMPGHLARLRRDRTTSMIIEAPSAEWVQPLMRAAKRLGEWTFAHAVSEPPRKSMNGMTISDQAILAMANGGRIIGVTQNLDYLPKAMTASADIRLKIDHPDDELLRQAIKMATGRYPRSMTAGISHGLDYSDICSAIRTGSTAKACVERLVAASKAKSEASPGLEDVPPVEELFGYGEELEGWAKALISDIDAWRAGKLDFSAIQRTAVLASEPGLGKTTFARSLAKSAGIPFFPTSVSQWFSNSAGYLDSIIKQIDEVFAAAAAVAPAMIFLDECEGIPSRANADRHSSWWIPVVGHMLLKLDSATSGDSSKLIVVGATNHPEKLDAALVRPGRLSKIIHIRKPDATALAGIIRQHLGKDLPDADLEVVAKLGVGASGADVHDWVKSARLAARQQNRSVTLQDLFNQVAPPDNRPPGLVRRIAVHEAAHAVVSHVLMPGSVDCVTTISRKPSEGGSTTMSLVAEDAIARRDIEHRAMVLLAGRCGEEVLLNSVSSGAGGGETSDLAQATYMLALVHTSLGLGDRLLHRSSPQEVKQLLTLDPVLAKTVEEDLQRLYANTLEIVRDNATVVERVAEALLKQRHLTGDQFVAICRRAERTGTVKLLGGSNG
ncbi:AAA family ATPase [Devosia sp. PTR5]|uniref:AAA family ATPase n=1 Tax=Devosia oryzisoli TaxID=2774138 RepID=A0A927ITQ0_9HYPH|nr:AAA family ATPase [Devosia oryzisoli]MBD8066048.1 AAA family ATPase [Devosia oryzisoli]